MDPDVTPEPEKPKLALKHLLAPLRKLTTALKNLPIPKKLPIPKNLPIPKSLPIPKKLVIPAIACVVLLAVGGVAFGLLHARLKPATVAHVKGVGATPVASTTGPSAACGGVVRDIYRQTVDEDPSVTLAEVRSEVLSSGVSCVPVPEIAAELKGLSPACRDMVQYTFLEVRDGHPEIRVSDIRVKVVRKSVACEHDRPTKIATAARIKTK